MYGRRERLAVVDPRAGSEPGLIRTSGAQLWPPSVDRHVGTALVGGGHLIDPAAPEVLGFIEELFESR